MFVRRYGVSAALAGAIALAAAIVKLHEACGLA